MATNDHSAPTDISTQIFVGKLDPAVNEAQLKEYFQQFGAISKVFIKRDQWTMKSRGFAFVVFEDSTAAAGALAHQGHEINGQEIGLRAAEDRRWSTGSSGGPKADPKRVWIGGLPAEATSDDLKNYFEQFGTVETVELKNDSSGASKGFAFITFGDDETAKAALNFTPHMLGDKEIEVKRPNPKPADKGMGKGAGKNSMGGGWGGMMNGGMGGMMNPMMMMMNMMSGMGGGGMKGGKGKGKGKGMGMGMGGMGNRWGPY